MTIGVGVEGPSDRAFWDKVLHKHFPGVHFDIRNMNSRGKLIRQTPRLLDTFRSLHYAAGFILVDRDKDPCIAAILQRFDEVSREEARRPADERYLSFVLLSAGLRPGFSPMLLPSRRCCPRPVTPRRVTPPV